MRRANRIPALAFALPLPLPLPLPFPFSFPKGKVSLCARLYQLCTHFRVKIIILRVCKNKNHIQFSCLENSNITQSNIRRKRVVFLITIIVQCFFPVVTSKVNWIVAGLLGVCGFIHVVIIIVIFNGSEVRVVGTSSRFSAANVFTLAFSSKPTSF